MNQTLDHTMRAHQALVFYAAFLSTARDFIYISINRFLHNKGLDESCGCAAFHLHDKADMTTLFFLHISKLDPHWYSHMQHKSK